jgi:hypothetical protein
VEIETPPKKHEGEILCIDWFAPIGLNQSLWQKEQTYPDWLKSIRAYSLSRRYNHQSSVVPWYPQGIDSRPL